MKFTYNQKLLYRNIGLFILIIIFGYIYLRWPFYKYVYFQWSQLLWLLGVLALVLLFSKTGTAIGNIRSGRISEIVVEDKLRELPAGYKILSNIIIGKQGNIDVVVVGPTGVWVVEVKSHKGAIGFNGEELTQNGRLFKEKDFLKQAWAQKKNVEELLKNNLNLNIYVQPVILFENPDAFVRFGLTKQNGVYVIGYDWLLKLIGEQYSQNHINDQVIRIIENELQKYKE